jgi:thiamine kinase-like enzyme
MEGKTATKIIYDLQKGRHEIIFYKSLPQKINKFFPKLLSTEVNKYFISYKMEYISALDVSVFFSNGLIDQKTFRLILDHLNAFFKESPKKMVTQKTWQKKTLKLIVHKLNARWSQYKKTYAFSELNQKFKAQGFSIDDLKADVVRDLRLKIQHTSEYTVQVSHGDLCFSNILLTPQKKVKFIDPRGGAKKDDMYLTPYYDLAKLSQCVLGNYDSILRKSKIPFGAQKKIFTQWLRENNIDVKFVRLIESSLFLSLLPMHMDRVDVHYSFVQAAIKAFKASI